MASVMIPASSIAATLSADLTYNPSIHVQTVEVDRAGAGLAQMATDNFVKWYITLKDFQNLCWNVRDLPHYSAASDVDASQNIFAFARSHDWVYDEDPFTIKSPAAFTHDAKAEYADTAEPASRTTSPGVYLEQEASGGCVKFNPASLSLSVPLYSDVPAHGSDISAGAESLVGATTVTYDRVMLDDDATDLTGTRTTASATTTTWGFVDTSFNLTVNWVAGQGSAEQDFSDAPVAVGAEGPTGVTYAGMDHWGSNTICVYASAGSTIAVTKPHNDAAADFIQIGMDASGATSSFRSGTGTTTAPGGQALGQYSTGTGVTTMGVEAADTGMGHGASNTDGGLSDPNVNAGSSDDTSDSIDFTAYFADYTATHNDSRRNLIEVNIGKPTVQVSEHVFTKALQQAIDQDQTNVRDVSNSQSLRYAVEDAFKAGHLRGFQAGLSQPTADSSIARNQAIELDLPLTVAGQVRYAEADNTSGRAASAGDAASAGSDHKKVYLTPVIELVENGYYHPSWYTYTAVA